MSKDNNESVISKALAKPMSRRGFFSLTAITGALTVLGSISTENAVLRAYADEAGQVHYFIDIVNNNRKLMPIVAVDVSGTEQKAVEGMEVKVESYDRTEDGKPYSTTCVTDEYGMAYLDVCQMSSKHDQVLSRYDAAISVKATQDGYQTYENDFQVAFSGGTNSVIEIPTKEIKKNRKNIPYISSCCLNGIDIVSDIQVIAISEAADPPFVCDLKVKAVNLPNPPNVITLTFLCDGNKLSFTEVGSESPEQLFALTKTYGSDRCAEFFIEGEWFRYGNSGMHAGSVITVNLEIDGYGSIVIAPRLKINPSNKFGDNSKDDKQSFTPGKDGGIGTDDEVLDPKNFFDLGFCFGSLKPEKINFTIPFPGFNFYMTENEFGFSTTIVENTLFKRCRQNNVVQANDPDDVKKWSWAPDCKTLKKLDDDFNEKFKGAGYHPDTATHDHFHQTSSFDVKLSLAAEAIGHIAYFEDYSDFEMLMKIIAHFQLALQYEYTAYMWYVIPFYVGFDVGFTTDFSPRFNFILHENKEHKLNGAKYADADLPEDQRGMALFIELAFELGLYAGAGIKGYISLFIRGYGSLKPSILFAWDAGVKFHLPYEVGATVVFEAIICSKEFTVFDPISGEFFGDDDKVSLFKQIENNDPNDPFKNIDKSKLKSLLKDKLNAEEDTLQLITEDKLRGVVESTTKLSPFGNALAESYTPVSKNLFNVKKMSEVKVKNPFEANGPLPYNPVKGLRYDSVDKICEDVFFSSHSKTFIYKGNLYMLRISAVEIEIPNEDYYVYSNGVCNFVVADENAKRPQVKFDKDGNVVFDSNDKIVYDIPDGMDGNVVAEFDDECFTGKNILTSSNSKHGRVNAFFKSKKAESDNEKDYLSKQRPANATKVVRTRVTCAKYDLEKKTWDKPNVVDFDAPSTGSLIDDRYNCFDTEMDVATNGSQVKLVITSTTRSKLDTAPTFNEIFTTQHIYSLTYNVVTQEVRNVILYMGDTHLSPRMPEFDRFACYRVVSNTASKNALSVSDAKLSVYDNVNGMVALSEGLDFEDPRFKNELVNGLFENHLFGAEGYNNNYSTLTAWINPDKDKTSNEEKTGGLAAFWNTYVEVSPSGEKEIKHHFQHLEYNVENFVYLGVVDNDDAYFNKCVRYLITRMTDKDDVRRYDILTMKYNSSNGEFNPDCELSHDLFGSANVTNIIAGEDANHIYASRIMDPPKTRHIFNKKKFANSNIDVSLSQGPYVSNATSSLNEDADGSLYQILEGRWNDDVKSFCQMYPICELPIAPDSLEFIHADENYRYFIVNNITNVADVKGDVYMVTVPFAISAVVESVRPLESRIVKDDVVNFKLELSNSGNMPITGFRLTAIAKFQEREFLIYDKEVFDNLGDLVLQTTADNYKAVLDEETGKPTTDEEDNVVFKCQDDEVASSGILWPGARKTFAIPFSVNEDLPEFTLDVFITEYFCDDKVKFDKEIVAQKNDMICYAVDNRTFSNKIDNRPKVNKLELGVSDTDYQITDTEGNIIDETSPAVVSNIGDSPITHASANTETGDKLPLGLGIAGVAAGAAAAGAAIYNKRRSENENKDE